MHGGGPRASGGRAARQIERAWKGLGGMAPFSPHSQGSWEGPCPGQCHGRESERRWAVRPCPAPGSLASPGEVFSGHSSCALRAWPSLWSQDEARPAAIPHLSPCTWPQCPLGSRSPGGKQGGHWATCWQVTPGAPQGQHPTLQLGAAHREERGLHQGLLPRWPLPHVEPRRRTHGGHQRPGPWGGGLLHQPSPGCPQEGSGGREGCWRQWAAPGLAWPGLGRWRAGPQLSPGTRCFSVADALFPAAPD